MGLCGLSFGGLNDGSMAVCAESMFEQQCRECGRERYGHDDADAARKALHDDNVQAVGVEELQQRQVVDVVEHPGAEAAAEDGEDQRGGHRAHDILPDAHAALEERPRGCIRVLAVDLDIDMKRTYSDIHHISLRYCHLILDDSTLSSECIGVVTGM